MLNQRFYNKYLLCVMHDFFSVYANIDAYISYSFSDSSRSSNSNSSSSSRRIDSKKLIYNLGLARFRVLAIDETPSSS